MLARMITRITFNRYSFDSEDKALDSFVDIKDNKAPSRPQSLLLCSPSLATILLLF